MMSLLVGLLLDFAAGHSKMEDFSAKRLLNVK